MQVTLRGVEPGDGFRQGLRSEAVASGPVIPCRAKMIQATSVV